MGRQIIQTNGPGKARAQRRRLLTIALVIALIVLAVAFIVHPHATLTKSDVVPGSTPMTTWTQPPMGSTPQPPAPQ